MQDDRRSNVAGHEIDRGRQEENRPGGAAAGGEDVDLRAKSMRKREIGETESDAEAEQEEQTSD